MRNDNVEDLSRARARKVWEDNEDNRELTLRQTLELILENIDELEAEGFNRGMMVLLDDREPDETGYGTYRTAWFLCGMRASETVVLCEHMKIDMFKMMGRIPMEDGDF